MIELEKNRSEWMLFDVVFISFSKFSGTIVKPIKTRLRVFSAPKQIQRPAYCPLRKPFGGKE